IIRATGSGNTPYTILVHRYRPDGSSLSTIQLEGSGSSAFVVPSQNEPPLLAPIFDRAVDEGDSLSFVIKAADPDVSQTVTYSLDSAPVGAGIDPNTGVFTWTPTDGPASVQIVVQVTDNGSPALSDTKTFTITVNNVAPTATLSNDGPVA